MMCCKLSLLEPTSMHLIDCRLNLIKTEKVIVSLKCDSCFFLCTNICNENWWFCWCERIKSNKTEGQCARTFQNKKQHNIDVHFPVPPNKVGQEQTVIRTLLNLSSLLCSSTFAFETFLIWKLDFFLKEKCSAQNHCTWTAECKKLKLKESHARDVTACECLLEH